MSAAQLTATRQQLEALHERYCPQSSYSATSKRTCGTTRPAGRHLFRVAAKGVMAARRLWRLRNGHRLDGTLAELGPAIKVAPPPPSPPTALSCCCACFACYLISALAVACGASGAAQCRSITAICH